MSAGRIFSRLGPFWGLAGVVLLFSILTPGFLFGYQTVVVQSCVVALGAIGMTFIIVSGGIDLSQGSIIALSSVVTAVCLRGGAPPFLAMLAGVAAGGVCGLLNGLLVVTLRIVPFVVTLGTLGIIRGVAKELADLTSVAADGGWLVTMLSKADAHAWLFLPPGVWLVAGLALLMGCVLRSTPFGIHALAIGSNEATARLCGVRVEHTKVWVYTIGGLFAGLAGVFLFARITQGDPTAAVGKELEIIAAVVIGGGSLSGGAGGIWGSLLGALIMAFLSFGCSQTGVATHVQEILIGAIIIVAVAADRLRQRR